MLNQLLFTVFEISFTDYFFQILNFLSFFTLLSFINQNKFYLETTFTLSNLCYYFIDDEEEILTENDFSFSNEYLANSAIFNGSISLDEAKDSFNSYFSDFLATTEDYIFGYDSASYLYLPYCEFFEAESLELNNGFFMFFIAAFAFAALYFFFRELGDEESEMILNFIQLGFTFLTATHDLFTLFLGFEFLTISFVLGMVLMQEKYSYSRNVITYFILNVAVSLVIFFFCFFILLICSNTLFFGLNFSFFFFRNVNVGEFFR